MTDRKEPQLGEVAQAPRDDRIPTLTEIVAIDEDSNTPPAPRITRWDTDFDALPPSDPSLPDSGRPTGNDHPGPGAFREETAAPGTGELSNRREQDPAEPDSPPQRQPDDTLSTTTSPSTPPLPGEYAGATETIAATEPGAPTEPARPAESDPAIEPAPPKADTISTAVPSPSPQPSRDPIETSAIDFSAYDFVTELATKAVEPPRNEPAPAVLGSGTTLELSSEELEVLADRVLDALAPVLRETIITALYEILAGPRHRPD